MKVLRIDDIPLLYEQIKELKIQEIIDKAIKPHGNWSGLSIGHLISLWMCYLLSESDHRLSFVESWAEENLVLLGAMSGQVEISAKDFTDDRLEQSLDYISKKENWLVINNQLSASSLSVYEVSGLGTVRLDSAPMQGHHKIKPDGLFQHGYTKHHDPRLGMIKVMLASVDNQLNGFGCPLAHMVVSGAQADDRLYVPVIKQCEAVFKKASYLSRKLYVGDSKMGSRANRSYIVSTKNDYLMPLSKVQLSANHRQQIIAKQQVKKFKKVYKEGTSKNRELVAQGFEQQVEMNYMDEDGEEKKWIERRIFVLSTAYSLAQQKSLDSKLSKAVTTLKNLVISKQGKRIASTREELRQEINIILQEKNLGKLLHVEIKEEIATKDVRAYKDRPARIEEHSSFKLETSRIEEEIAAYKLTLGWQVYATSAEKKVLNVEQCVWKYRYQNRVERQFDNLRNKVVPLVPIFLQQENRVEALINLLMTCLKVCAAIEYKVAKKLKEKKEELNNIYEGNPKRNTSTPTAKRLLRAFKGISLVVNKSNGSKAEPQIMLTDLKITQSKIIVLLGFKETLYSELIAKIQLFFLSKKISEN